MATLRIISSITRNFTNNKTFLIIFYLQIPRMWGVTTHDLAVYSNIRKTAGASTRHSKTGDELYSQRQINGNTANEQTRTDHRGFADCFFRNERPSPLNAVNAAASLSSFSCHHSLANCDSCLTPAKSEAIEYLQAGPTKIRYSIAWTIFVYL